MTPDFYRSLEYGVLGAMAVASIVLLIASRGRYRGPAVIALGGLMGAAYFIAIQGPRIVDPRQISWLRGDYLNHFLGWHVFRGESWQFPPGAIRTLLYPYGTAIGLTDSIPLFAFAFKGLHSVLPVDFQYIGLWLLCAFALQGVFAVLLVRTLTSSVALQLTAAALLFLSPPMLYRLGHPALDSHWLLLASVWMYVISDRTATRRRLLAGWLILVGVAAATHVYLTVMVCGIAAAAHARLIVEDRRRVWSAAASLLALAGTVLGVWWAVGFFTVPSSAMRAAGMEEFSMNLLSFITHQRASALLPALPLARIGQYEGFNYLGLGVLLFVVLAFGLLASRKPTRASVTSALPLVTIVVLFAVFALSPEVTAGPHVVFTLPAEIWNPFAALRAPGRFGWPAHYVLVFFAVALVVRRLSPRTALVCTCAALALQILDLGPYQLEQRAFRRRAESYRANPRFLSSSFWHVVLPHYRHLVFWPANSCVPSGFAPTDRYEPFVYLAGRYRLTTNTGWTARINGAAAAGYCEAMWTDIKQGAITEDAVYVVHPDHTRWLFDTARTPIACLQIEGYDTCVTKRSMLQWRDSYLEAERQRGAESVDTALRSPAFPKAEPENTNPLLPSADDLTSVQQLLELIYRDHLHRASAETSVSDRTAAEAFGTYLALRLRGCSQRGAVNRTLLAVEGIGIPDCPGDADRGVLPPLNETMDFRLALEQDRTEAGGANSPTHVDAEGEAVWTQEYVRQRLLGCTHDAAASGVRAAVTQGKPVATCH